jgi:hypothetical protein
MSIYLCGTSHVASRRGPWRHDPYSIVHHAPIHGAIRACPWRLATGSMAHLAPVHGALRTSPCRLQSRSMTPCDPLHGVHRSVSQGSLQAPSESSCYPPVLPVGVCGHVLRIAVNHTTTISVKCKTTIGRFFQGLLRDPGSFPLGFRRGLSSWFPGWARPGTGRPTGPRSANPGHHFHNATEGGVGRTPPQAGLRRWRDPAVRPGSRRSREPRA